MPIRTRTAPVTDLLESIDTGRFHVDAARISLVTVEKKDFERDFAGMSVDYFMAGVPAQVFGESLYSFANTQLLVNWRLDGAYYQFSQGLQPSMGQVSIQGIDVMADVEYVNEEGEFVAPGDLNALILRSFNEHYQDWKTHALIYSVGLQPTHFKVPDPYAGSDFEQVSEFTALELSELENEQGLNLLVSRIFDEFTKDDDRIFRGFSAYSFRALEEKLPVYIFLNWAMRLPIEDEGRQLLRPEIMLVDSESSSRVLLAGAALVDAKGRPVDMKDEAIFLFKLLHGRRDWIDSASAALFKRLTKHAKKMESEVNELEAVKDRLLASISDKARKILDQTHEEEDALKEFVVVRENQRDLKFEGRRLGSVTDASEHDRMITLELYLTRGGKWVAVHELSAADDQQESLKRVEVMEASDEQSLFAFFGQDEYAKRLYHQAGIDFVEFID
jgi:hypothetical protein